jgi:hypothetical protein
MLYETKMIWLQLSNKLSRERTHVGLYPSFRSMLSLHSLSEDFTCEHSQEHTSEGTLESRTDKYIIAHLLSVNTALHVLKLLNICWTSYLMIILIWIFLKYLHAWKWNVCMALVTLSSYIKKFLLYNEDLLFKYIWTFSFTYQSTVPSQL